MAVNVLSWSSKKDEKSGCHHDHDRAHGPRLELLCQPGERIVAQAKANQPQIQHHDCGQKHRESQQMEGLNHRHAELAIANENDRRPVGDGLKKRKKMHIRIDEL
jgi:hypothetical protein